MTMTELKEVCDDLKIDLFKRYIEELITLETLVFMNTGENRKCSQDIQAFTNQLKSKIYTQLDYHYGDILADYTRCELLNYTHDTLQEKKELLYNLYGLIKGSYGGRTHNEFR